MSEENWF